MHPGDVAECVAEEVARLRARLADTPQLRAGEVELRDRFELRVPFRKVGYKRAFPIQIPVRGVSGLRRTVPVRIGRMERDLVLRSFCDNYDGQAITAELLLPDGGPLPNDEWPKTLGREAIIRGHEEYDRPFFCRRGLREYHSHPQHQDNPWDGHRESIRIDDVVLELLHDLQNRWDIG